MGVHRVKVPKCTESCSVDDPGRFSGIVRLKNRVFEWRCCPRVGCLHIGELPRRRTIEESDEMKELLALKLLARILKGQRPWRDLALVEALMPPAID